VRIRASAAVAAASILLLGCGSQDSEEPTTGSSAEDASTAASPGEFQPSIVTDEDLRAADRGSPERALLEWWQAYQFKDVGATEGLTSEATLSEIGEDELGQTVQARGLPGIDVLDVTENGDRASIRAALLSYTPEKVGDPPPQEPTSATPATLEMVKEGGDWRFAGTAYLQSLVASVAAAQ
jgi:hypothetical protein